VLARFGVLEWTFTILLIVLVAAAGVFGLYVVIQQFRNPGRRA
jgi:hypothetical protein